MAVTTKNSSDKEGINIDAQIATAQANVNALSSTGTSHYLYQQAALKLKQLQTEAVQYYIGNGRINPATILSTLT